MAKRRFRSRGKFRTIRRRRFSRRRGMRKLIKRVVRRMSETKFNVEIGNGVVDANDGLFDNVTPTWAQGTSKNQVIGNKIRYKYLQLRLSIYLTDISQNSTQTFAYVRVILFQPRLTVTPPATPKTSDRDWETSVR